MNAMAEILRTLHGVLPVCFFGVTLLFLIVTLFHYRQIQGVHLRCFAGGRCYLPVFWCLSLPWVFTPCLAGIPFRSFA